MAAPITSRPAQAIKSRAGRVFYGWWIAVAGLINNYYNSGTMYYGFGTFFNPIVDSFHWSRASTSAAFSIQQAESGAIAPFVGYFVDRFGPRRVMVAGVLVTGLGFILLAGIQSLWQFYAVFLLLALGASFGSFIVIVTTVNNWFITKRGRAMAIMTTGAGLAGTLAPVLVIIISAVGWRWALFWVGIGTWVVGIPTALVMRRRPEDYGLVPDGAPPQALSPSGRRQARIPEGRFSVRDALRTPTFWQLAIGLSLGGLASSAIMVHLIPAQVDAGIPRATAATAMMLLTLLSLVGRWVGGVLADYVDKRMVLAVAFVLQVGGTLLLAFATSFWMVVLALCLFSPGFGAAVPTRWALLADYFGRRSFGSLMGIVMTIGMVFGIAPPIFAGWMFDELQSYRLAFILLAAVSVLAVPLMLVMQRPASSRPRATPPGA